MTVGTVFTCPTCWGPWTEEHACPASYGYAVETDEEKDRDGT